MRALKTASERGKSSRARGKVGERELAAVLTEAGYPARRAQQYRGTESSADIACELLELLGLHIECKRTERLLFNEWWETVVADAGNKKTPVICWRKDRGDWIAFIPLTKLLALIHPAALKALEAEL